MSMYVRRFGCVCLGCLSTIRYEILRIGWKKMRINLKKSIERINLENASQKSQSLVIAWHWRRWKANSTFGICVYVLSWRSCIINSFGIYYSIKPGWGSNLASFLYHVKSRAPFRRNLKIFYTQNHSKTIIKSVIHRTIVIFYEKHSQLLVDYDMPKEKTNW